MKAKLIIRYSKLGADHLTFFWGGGGGGGGVSKIKNSCKNVLDGKNVHKRREKKILHHSSSIKKMLKTVILSLLKESFNF